MLDDNDFKKELEELLKKHNTPGYVFVGVQTSPRMLVRVLNKVLNMETAVHLHFHLSLTIKSLEENTQEALRSSGASFFPED